MTNSPSKCGTAPIVKAMVSRDRGNSIQQRPDGLFAPAIVYRESTNVVPGDSSVQVTEQETEKKFKEFSITSRISDSANNTLKLLPDGLYAPEPSFPDVNVEYLYEGNLIYNPLVPAQGTVTYVKERNIIRILNNISTVIVPIRPAFENVEELYIVQDITRTAPIVLSWPAGVTIDNIPGPATKQFRAGASIHMIRHSSQNWLILFGGGIDEAPSDGKTYGRVDNNWEEVASYRNTLYYVSETATTAMFATAEITIISDPGPGPYASVTIEVEE